MAAEEDVLEFAVRRCYKSYFQRDSPKLKVTMAMIFFQGEEMKRLITKSK